MKNKFLRSVLFITALFTFSFAFAVLVKSWSIGADITIDFISDHPSGFFKGLKGTILFDKDDLSNSKFDVTVDVSTIDTDNSLRDKHALADTWFDADNYPMIKYTSSEILKTETGYLSKGILEMKGKKKETSISFTFKEEGTNGFFEGSFDVDRTNFDIGKPGGKVPNVMKIRLKVPVVLNP